MLFIITKRLLEVAESKGRHAETAQAALEYLDIANRLGKHFICVESSDLCDRIDQLKIKADSLARLKARHSFDMQIAQLFLWHAEIVDIERSVRDDDKKTVYISLNDIPRFEVYLETHVIGENLKDITFFKYILSYYKKKHNCQSVRSVLYPLLGGGSTTAEVLDNEQSLSQAFSLCISDSDYAFPKARLGDTAKRILDKYEKGKCFCSYYYHFDLVGEVENLIPMSLYKLYSKKESPELFARYSRVENSVTHNPEFLNYFDFKEGVSLRSFEKANDSEYLYEWMRAENPDIKIRVTKDRARLKQTPIPYGKEELKEEEKKCKYLEGFGSKILDNILARVLGETIVAEMEYSASDAQRKEYEEIGRLLFDWCCAGPVVRL